MRKRSAFTLMETALATIIVGVGIVSTLQLFAACTMENRASSQMTTAMLLVSNIQEAMTGMSFNDPVWSTATFGAEAGETLATYNDIDDFDGKSFNPPIDSTRTTLTDLSKFTQVVSVVPIFTNKLSSNTNSTTPEIAKTTYTGAARVTVRVLYKPIASKPATEIYRSSWVRVDG